MAYTPAQLIPQNPIFNLNSNHVFNGFKLQKCIYVLTYQSYVLSYESYVLSYESQILAVLARGAGV